MQKWDYTVLTVNSRLRVLEMNKEAVELVSQEYTGLFGGKGEEKAYPNLHSFLQDLGKQGWEVCGITPFDTTMDGSVTRITILLKRPLEE